MARVKGKHTKPELVVRRLLHGLGYRFRIHHAALPGRPDLAFTARRKVVLVHGCFWHSHEGCRGSRVPVTRTAFWQAKFEANRERDKRQDAEREAVGWRSLVVWECEMRDRAVLRERLVAFLGPPRSADRTRMA